MLNKILTPFTLGMLTRHCGRTYMVPGLKGTGRYGNRISGRFLDSESAARNLARKTCPTKSIVTNRPFFTLQIPAWPVLLFGGSFFVETATPF